MSCPDLLGVQLRGTFGSLSWGRLSPAPASASKPSSHRRHNCRRQRLWRTFVIIFIVVAIDVIISVPLSSSSPASSQPQHHQHNHHHHRPHHHHPHNKQSTTAQRMLIKKKLFGVLLPQGCNVCKRSSLKIRLRMCKCFAKMTDDPLAFEVVHLVE